MIQEKELIEIGKILKPHGVKGEMTFLFNKKDFADADNNYYFFLLDGTYVPFFIEEFRFISNVSANIKIEGLNSIEAAINYNDTLIYLPKELIKETEEIVYLESEWDRFIGYTILDEKGKIIGVIEEVDASTMNVLFVVVNEMNEFLIPATTNFILEINSIEKELHLSLPDGLLDNGL